MGFSIVVPDNKDKLVRGIESLKWQIENETDPKSKDIFEQTLKLYEEKLLESKEGIGVWEQQLLQEKKILKRI